MVAGIPSVSLAVAPFALSTPFVSINVAILFGDTARVLVAIVVGGTGAIISSIGRWLALWLPLSPLLISLSMANRFDDVSVGVMISASPFSLDAVASCTIAVAIVIDAAAVAVVSDADDVHEVDDDVGGAFASLSCDLIGNDAQLVASTPPPSAGMAQYHMEYTKK